MAQEHQALTLADLSATGTALTPEEAVALTLSIAERLGWSEPPLDPALIVVRDDGTVHLPRPANAAPASPAQYADLLQRLLSFGRVDGHGGVPGALLLLVARARGEIDLPPFASADEFRHALLRLLPRPCAQVIAAGMSRWRPEPVAPVAPARVPERRVTGPRVDELRRMLRDADLERIALAARIRQHEAPATVRRPRVPAAPPDGPTKVGRYTVRGARQATDVRDAAGAMLPPPTRGERPTPPVAAPMAASQVPPTLFAEPSRGSSDPRRAVAAAFAALSLAAGGLFWTTSRGSVRQAVPAMASAQPVERRAPTTARGTASVAQVPRGEATNSPERQTRSTAAAQSTHIVESAVPPGPAAHTRVADLGRVIGDIAAEPAAMLPARSARRRDVGIQQALHTLPVPVATAYSPSFSPDGESVYFHAEGRNGSRLMRADTDDRGDVRDVATIVDDGAQNFHVRLSPDGSRVAFDSDRDGVRGIYVAGRDGTKVRRVSGPGYAAVPVWSPDGRQLLYVRAEPGAPRTWNLWRLSLDTRAEQRVTSHRYGEAWPGSWFGDGQQICYTHEDRMYVLDLRTGRSQSIPSPVAGRLVRTAAVSPNGTYVAFQVYRDGMWLLDLRDRSMRKVLEDPTAEEFTWSPDGRRIAFHSRREGHWGVWVMASPS